MQSFRCAGRPQSVEHWTGCGMLQRCCCGGGGVELCTALYGAPLWCPLRASWDVTELLRQHLSDGITMLELLLARDAALRGLCVASGPQSCSVQRSGNHSIARACNTPRAAACRLNRHEDSIGMNHKWLTM